MPQRLKYHMSFLLLALGSIFLFHPIVELYDVLPDLFGYVLIYFGLWRLSDLSDEFTETMRLVRTMMWVSVGQMIAQWLLHVFLPSMTQTLNQTGGSINQYEHPVWMLVISFAWAMLSWYFLIPTFKHLFAGFEALASRSESVALQKERRGVPLWKRMQKKSVYFAIMMPLFALLPEFSILTSFGMDSGLGKTGFDWYDFIWMFRAVLGIAAGIVGLRWMISWIAFYIRILRDKAFCNALWDRYECEVLPRKNWLIYRRWSLAITLIFVGLLFAADFRMDNHPILLTAICAALVFVGALVLKTCNPVGLISLGVIGTALSVVSIQHQRLMREYLIDHLPKDALYVPRAYHKFLTIRTLEVVEAGLLCIFLFTFFILFWNSVMKLEKQIGKDVFSKDKKRYLTKLILSLLVLSGFTVASCFNAIFQLDFRFLWWIGFLLALILVFLFRSLMLDVKEEIYFCAQSEQMHRERENDTY